ncbi:MAG: AAA family ATPase [Oleispira sp.]|nr:AAA family ATPase [Oleispira sp.]MBL4880078.1 AAA family ATPase [Oleispira sp.]
MSNIIYLKNFGFQRAPFQITTDDTFLYLSKQHSKAMAYMDYAVSQSGGFVIITGEIGSGKTILLKRMIRRFSKKAVCINLSFTNLDGEELFQYVAEEAGLNIINKTKVGLIFSLKKYFLDNLNRGKPCVLVIDEAQNLSSENLEDLRMLAGLEANDRPLLRVVMLGQPEFMVSVNRSEQLKQRVKLHYHLSGLNEVEVSKYIDHRLLVAGTDVSEIFSAEVIKVIYQYSRGIPRLINKICDALLLCAFIEERKYTLKSDIDEVADDLMISKPSETVPSDMVSSNGDPIDRVVHALESINKNLESLVNSLSVKEKVS